MSNPKIEQFKKVLQLDPNDETLWFGLGNVYMDDETWDEAISAFQRCLAVQPRYSAAYYALAKAYHHAGDLEACRRICEHGIEVASSNGDLLVVKNLEALKSSLA
ncbi:MAG: hypothetical protein D6690_11975 [Nitrospirae bacterium]|nr:MAG: hypothetical protein D6690_11975 [Nitrospirota bacterium]